ncbi:MAG TPA: protein kinase [Polyangiales bacterium]|nr:protein kinase [Polyangiales bacterium]
MEARAPSRPAPALTAEVDVSRYEIESKLGEGGAGAVYLARDRETGDRVALKKLFRMDAKSVLRLKREFRSLVDIAHPNIVKLYDMGRASDSWFLTMEYLEGVELATYLAPPEAAAQTPDTIAEDNRRVMSAFQQLARAVHALHQAGMLHRDLKPSNVLVVGERVVVLDFGLVRELGGHAATVTEDGSISGTPAYMAPEQLRGNELTEASDWYAFGVILYEALSDTLPIDGTLLEILRGKLESEPLPLRDLVPNVPRWLDELCMALLQRDPAARPRGSDVVAAFERAGTPGSKELPRTATENVLPTENETRSLPLFGRHKEQGKLWRALQDSQQGRAAVVHVRGLSGAGKSALIEHFLDELDAESSSLILRSRCYELEQMPFKALDAVMDALVRHLLHLSDIEVAQILPHEIGALSRLFPVLERLPATKQLAARSKLVRDNVSERACAELALRQLLDRLAMHQPIVLWIDDLQWGDLDSARMLRSWLREPTQCPILFVFSYRSDEVATSSCLSSLLQDAASGDIPPAVEHLIDVSSLGSDDIRALCEQRLTAAGAQDPEIVSRIVREAQGSPFFALQLAALAETKLGRGDADLESLTIDALVAQTSAILSDDAKKVLDVLAVAGRPMPPKLAFAAAAVHHNGRAIVHALRGLSLVRTRDVGGSRMLEVYHDRVRERVSAALDQAQSAALHRALLNALEFSGQADPGWLHGLALGAGDHEQAFRFGLAAAQLAWSSLAFERAAEVYQRCVELAPADQLGELKEKLALAFARSGHGGKAADAYLDAAKHVPLERRARFTQLAASHLVRSGHFERGEALVHQTLNAMDASLPKSDAAVVAAIAWERARLALRGTAFKLREADAEQERLVETYDVFEALGASIQQYDPLRATLLQARAFRYALDTGEPRRIVRALCYAAINVAVSGAADAGKDADLLLERAETLAQQLPEYAYGTVCFGRAVSSFMLSRLQGVVQPSLDADRVLRAAAAESPETDFYDYYRRFVVASVRIGARLTLGQVREASRELHEFVREAEATDNSALLLTLTLNRAYAERADGLESSSRARLDAHALELPKHRFGILHVLHMSAVMYVASENDDFAWADSHTERLWSQWLRSPIRGSGFLTHMICSTRSNLLMNRYLVERKPALLDEVRRDLKLIARNKTLPAGTETRGEARLAHAAGDRLRAAMLLRTSIERATARGVFPELACDSYALGALTEGPQGAAMQNAALAQLSELGFVDPRVVVRATFPEFVPK